MNRVTGGEDTEQAGPRRTGLAWCLPVWARDSNLGQAKWQAPVC